jgi:hypothetical protein
MASPEVRRSPSPPPKDGFLFKSGGTDEFDRLIKQGASPRSARPASGASARRSRPQSAAGHGFDTRDYSKLNEDRSNLAKVNTFNTPTGLNDKNFNTTVRVSKKDLYEICECSFRKSVHLLSKEILHDVKQEVSESLHFIRREAAEEAAAKSTRDAAMNVMLNQIHETLHERHCDFSMVQKEIRSGEMLVLEGYRDMMLRLEGKVLENIGQVRNELQDVRRAQEEAEDGLMAQIREL